MTAPENGVSPDPVAQAVRVVNRSAWTGRLTGLLDAAGVLSGAVASLRAQNRRALAALELARVTAEDLTRRVRATEHELERMTQERNDLLVRLDQVLPGGRHVLAPCGPFHLDGPDDERTRP